MKPERIGEIKETLAKWEGEHYYDRYDGWVSEAIPELIDAVEQLRAGYTPIIEMLDKVIETHFDFEIPENTGRPEPLETLEMIKAHIYGLFIGLEESKTLDGDGLERCEETFLVVSKDESDGDSQRSPGKD